MSRREGLNLGGPLDVDLAHLPFESALCFTTSRSWLEIDLDAIKLNIKTIREISGKGVEILLPVKADGYGHGAVEIAKEAVGCDIHWFGVASIEEALLLRRGGIEENILLLTPPIGAEVEFLVNASITPVISDLKIAALLNECAGKEGIIFPVHIEIDTGMGRTGVQWHQAIPFVKTVSEFSNLKLEGVFSHFSSADEEDPTFTSLQIERFEELMGVVYREVSPPPFTHISNSAAALRFPKARQPMIRPGLYIYGVSPLKPGVSEPMVSPVPAMSFRSRVVYVKDVDEGQPIGYSRTFLAPCKMRIATVAAGYRDGVHYGLSNKGEVLIRGKRCPIVGSICMDMLMTDVSSIDEIGLGDGVTLLGSDGSESIGADEIAGVVGGISYDVMTKLGNKVPRVYLRGKNPFKITSFLGTWETDGKECGS
jgi:alanine racemase